MSEERHQVPFCSLCGSEEVGVDATAVWNSELHKFEINNILDTTWCDACGEDNPGLSWKDEEQDSDSNLGVLISVERPAPSNQGNPLVLLNALKQIELIEHEEFGGDWDEIMAAQEIATAAISEYLGGADGGSSDREKPD